MDGKSINNQSTINQQSNNPSLLLLQLVVRTCAHTTYARTRAVKLPIFSQDLVSK